MTTKIKRAVYSENTSLKDLAEVLHGIDNGKIEKMFLASDGRSIEVRFSSESFPDISEATTIPLL